MKYTLFGAGAIGGSMAAYAVREGAQILFVDIVEEHVAAMNRKGLTIQSGGGDFTVPVVATTPDKLEGPLEVVFLATKTQHTRDAMKVIAPLLKEDGYVVSLQNGINEYVIAEYVGENRVVGAFVNWAADYTAPGVIRFGGHSNFCLGEMDGSYSERIKELQQLLSPFQKVEFSESIMSLLWSKQVNIGVMFCTGVTHLLIPGGLDYKPTQEAIACIALEQMQVPEKLNIELARFDDFDPELYRQGRYQEAMKLTADHYRYMAKDYTGLYRDLAVRKRVSEIDGTVGATIEAGEKLGLSLPLSRRMVEIVKEVEGGKRGICNENLLDIKKACEEIYPKGIETFLSSR